MTQSQTTAPSLLGLEEDGRDLFGLAAHKLNTPLACIRGFVSTLLQRGDQLDAETIQQFLSLVLTQTDRLQGLVRDFLLLARVNGGIEALARPFRPRDVLLTLVDDLGTEGVRVRFAGDVDSEAVGDAELVKLALRPLVENGLTYGPRLGMVTVTVDAGPQGTAWEVHDGGSRLTNERISQLFRPFSRWSGGATGPASASPWPRPTPRFSGARSAAEPTNRVRSSGSRSRPRPPRGHR